MTTLTADEFIARVFTAGDVPMPRVVKYGETISPHLHVGPDVLWSPDTQEFTSLPQPIQLFEEVREAWGKPIFVDAWYRTKAHEDVLTDKGLHTANFVSPHELGSAGDFRVAPGTFDGTQIQANTALRKAFRDAATKLGLPQPRVGHRVYKETLLHVDFMFMLFAPYTKLAHPSTWTDLQGEMRVAYSVVLKSGVEW